jgi:ribosomal protein S27AE
MKQIHVYTLDLTKINGSGDFSCPRCGTSISPDDCTEEAYSILEAKVNDQGLEELRIRCNKCSSQLHLTGFSLLQKLPETDKEEREN